MRDALATASMTPSGRPGGPRSGRRRAGSAFEFHVVEQAFSTQSFDDARVSVSAMPFAPAISSR
jgi:hypothetical protein